MRMNRDIEGVKSGVVLLEKSTVQSLRNENEVREKALPFLVGNAVKCFICFSFLQSLKVQMKRLLDSLKVSVCVCVCACVYACICVCEYQICIHFVLPSPLLCVCVCVCATVQEEVGKVQAGVRLDLNLEKSRAREEVRRRWRDRYPQLFTTKPSPPPPHWKSKTS